MDKIRISERYSFTVFVLLFVASIVQQTKISAVAILLVIVPALCLYSLIVSDRSRQDLIQFKWVVWLFVLIALTSLAALYLNRGRFSEGEFFVYGVQPLVISIFIPQCLLLFYFLRTTDQAYKDSNSAYAGLLLLLIALLGILQSTGNSTIRSVLELFVAGETLADSPDVITSVFRWHTDFGSLMGLSLVVALLFVFKSVTGEVRWKIVFLAALFFVAGVLSEARIFYIVVFVGTGYLLFPLFLRNWWRISLLLLSLLLLFYGFMFAFPDYFKRLYSLFPFLFYTNLGEQLTAVDFIPHVNNQSLSNRVELWQRAITLIKDNSLLGVSNGGFKVSFTEDWQRIHNTHNIVLQVLVDSGLVGLILVLVVITKIYHLTRFSLLVPITVLSALMFDVFIDHSMPWIIIVSWLLIQFGECNGKVDQFRQNICGLFDSSQKLFLVTGIVLVFGTAIILSALFSYTEQLQERTKMQPLERIANITASISWYEEIFIDKDLLIGDYEIESDQFYNVARVKVLDVAHFCDKASSKGAHFFISGKTQNNDGRVFSVRVSQHPQLNEFSAVRYNEFCQ
jgi:hypothetical protein